MTTLILATSTSPLFIREAVLEQNTRDILVVSLTPQVNNHLKQAGLPSQYIYADANESWGERDAAFARLAMPGVFGDEVFRNTRLPVWKVMSIDRLTFWYGGKNTGIVLDLLDSLEWNSLLFDLNIYSNYPVAALHLARKRDAGARAITTMPVRTNEYYDILPYLSASVDEIITSRRDAPFLASRADTKITVGAEEDQRRIESQSDADLRSGLGFEKSERIVGLLFDKRHEGIFRFFVPQYVVNGRVIVFCADDRSSELLSTSMAGYTIERYDRDVMRVCDEIISFSWDESLREHMDRLTILDPYEINRQSALAPEGVRIDEFNNT